MIDRDDPTVVLSHLIFFSPHPNLGEQKMVSTHDAEKGPPPALPADDNLGDRDGVSDPNEVFWDDDADPANPLNWKATYRWFYIVFVTLLTFVTYVLPGIFRWR